MRRVWSDNAEAKAEQARLQVQLREALKLHLVPESPTLDTASPLSQMVALVDDLLDVRWPQAHLCLCLNARRGHANSDA